MRNHARPEPIARRFGLKALGPWLALLLGSAQAQTVYFSNYSGDSTWGNAANWGDATTANLGPVPVATANLVFSDHVFSGSYDFQLAGDQSVALGQNRTAASLTFDATFNYTLQGFALTLDSGVIGSPTSITVSNGDPNGAHVIQSELLLNSDLNLTAATETALNLAGNITAGNHTFTLANNGTVTIAGRIGGSGTLTQTASSTGTTIIAGDSSGTYTGNIAVQGGTLQLGASNVLNPTTAVTLSTSTSTGTLDLGNYSHGFGGLTFAGGGMVKTGTGTLSLNGDVTTLAAAAAATITGQVNLGSATRTFNVAAGTASPADLAISAVVSGTGGVTKTGSGTLLLTGANTYTGGSTLSAGTTLAGSNSALGTGNVTVASGATLGLQGGITLNSGAITVSGSGYTGANGAIDSPTDANTVASNIVLAGSTTFGAGSGAQLTVAGAISESGASSLTIGGTGAVVLAGNNSFSGPTIVSSGATLIAAANGALGSVGNATTTTVTSGGTLALQGNITIANENIAFNGAGVDGNGGLTAYADTATITNQVTFAVNSTIGAADGATLILSGGLTDGNQNRSLTKVDLGTVVLTGASSWNLSTIINGGTLALAGANGAIADTTDISVNGATLRLDNSSANNANRISAPVTLNDGSLELIGNTAADSTANVTLVAGSGANEVHLTPAAGFRTDLTIDNLSQANNASIAFFDDVGTLGSGLLGSARVFLTKINGTTQGGTLSAPVALPGWILVGNDFAEYTGGSGVGNGIRAVASYDNSGTGLNVNSGTANVLLDNAAGPAQYTLNRSTTTSTTIDGNLKIEDLNSGNGTSIATLQDSRTLVLKGGGILKTAGTNNVRESTLAGAAARLQAGRDVSNLTVTTDTGTKLTIDPIIQNYQNKTTRGLLKAGAGTLVLTGTNTYTGMTYISAGTLQISKEANLGAATNDLTFNGSGTLAVTGTFTTNTGKAITIASDATGTLDIADGQTLTFSGSSLKTGNANSVLVKTGNGTFVLKSNNSGFGGNAVVNAGTLQLNASNSLGSGHTITLNGGALALRNNSSTTFATNLVVAGNAVISADRVSSGSGKTLGVGTVSVGAQTITFTGANGYDLEIGSLTLSGDAIVNTASLGNDVILDAIAGTGSFTKTGIGNITLAAAATYTGATTVNGGTLFSGKNYLPSTTALTIASGAIVNTAGGTQTLASLSGTGNAVLTMGTGALTVGDATNTVFSGTITAGIFTKNGSGSLTLAGSTGNTLTAFKLNEGTIIAAKSSGNATGTGAITIGNGVGPANSAVLRLAAANQIADGSAVTINSDGWFDLNGFNEGIASLSGSGNTNLGSATLSLLGNASKTYSGAISGTGSLIKNGTGTLILTGASSYSGNTLINAGTVRISSGTALGSGTRSVSVANGAGLELQGGITVADAALTIAGIGASSIGGLNNVSDDNTWSGALSLAGATTVNITAGNLTLGGAVGLGANPLTVSGVNTLRLNGPITGTGSVTMNGAGLLVFGGTGNTYSGTTTINAGTLQFGADQAGPGSSAVNLAASGTTLDLHNFNGAVGSLAGTTGTTVTLGSGNLTAGANNGSTTFSGGITGTGSFTKAGTGTLTLSGGTVANTLAGNFTVNDGTVILSKNSGVNATGTGTLVIGDGKGGVGSATVRFGSNANQINDTSAVILNSDGQLDLNAKTERIGSLTGSAGSSVVLGNGGALTTGNNNASTTFNGTISGSGATLTKEGTGTMVLGATNSFTGATTVNGGVLTLGASGAISSSAGLTLASGTGLALNTGVSQTITALTGSAGSTVDLGANSALTVSTTGSWSLRSAVSGTGTLTFAGGTITFTTDEAYGGTLVLGGSGTTTVNLAGYDLTVNTLHITGTTVLDFGASTATILSTTNLIIDTGVTVTVKNWVDMIDYFIAQNVQNGLPNSRGSSPVNQIVFSGRAASETVWQSWDNEITPSPEPETYGALLIGAAFGLIVYRRGARSARQTER